MRGYPDESPEVAAKKTLEAAARRYAGVYLANLFEVGALEKAETALGTAAIDFAHAVTEAMVKALGKRAPKRAPKPAKAPKA